VPVARQEQGRGSASEFDEKPSPGHLPVAHDALRRDLQHFRRFLDAQSSEESELDDSRFAWIDMSELTQRVVKTAPDPSVSLDLSQYPSLNCETMRPSHCRTVRRAAQSTLNCRQQLLSCFKYLGEVRFITSFYGRPRTNTRPGQIHRRHSIPDSIPLAPAAKYCPWHQRILPPCRIHRPYHCFRP
jgi:hypothetical protein